MSDGKNRCILALESSCDETAAAILKDGEMKSNIISTQIKEHQKFGGVYPELASVFIFKMLHQLSSWL